MGLAKDPTHHFPIPQTTPASFVCTSATRKEDPHSEPTGRACQVSIVEVGGGARRSRSAPTGRGLGPGGGHNQGVAVGPVGHLHTIAGRGGGARSAKETPWLR